MKSSFRKLFDHLTGRAVLHREIERLQISFKIAHADAEHWRIANTVSQEQVERLDSAYNVLRKNYWDSVSEKADSYQKRIKLEQLVEDLQNRLKLYANIDARLRERLQISLSGTDMGLTTCKESSKKSKK